MSNILKKLFTNTTSDAFSPIQKQVKVSKPAHNLTPSSNNPDLNLITPADYERSLRLAIQEYKQLGQQSPITEVEDILSLTELINPELIQGYQRLIETIEAKSKISKEHPQREFIDIESNETAAQVEQWTRQLIEEIELKKNSSLDQSDIYEIEALTWFHFDSLANRFNTKALEQDITEFYE